MLNIFRNYQMFSKASILFYIPISSVWGFQFLHILPNPYYYLSFVKAIIETGVWYFIEVLICISLIAKDAAYSCMSSHTTYLLWGNVYLDPLSFLKFDFLLFY